MQYRTQPIGEEKERLLRLTEVQARLGMSRSGIYERIKNGGFPRPVKIGPRAVAWLESEIDAWLQERVEARHA